MLQNIAPEITIASFSIIGLLTGYIWRDHEKRLCVVEKIQKEVLLIEVRYNIAKILTDIDWIKKYLLKN